MKKIIFVFFLLALNFCSDNPDKISELQSRIDSLQKKVDNTYIPGFGEFMSNIQLHHAKLWFAGTNENWKLAVFEINEIEESLKNIQKYQSDREESKTIPIIYPFLDSVKISLKNKNVISFKTSFTSLTNTCNFCHKAVKYEFNKIKIPDSPPFSNQTFRKEN